MAIVDQYGRALDRSALRETQTAALVALHREFATHPARGLTPARLARFCYANVIKHFNAHYVPGYATYVSF